MQNVILNCTDLPFLVKEYLHMITLMEIFNFGNHLILIYILEYKKSKECTENFIIKIWLPSERYSPWGFTWIRTEM